MKYARLLPLRSPNEGDRGTPATGQLAPVDARLKADGRKTKKPQNKKATAALCRSLHRPEVAFW
jgi:hypothetical protein